MTNPTPDQIRLAREIAARQKVGAAPEEILAGHWDHSPLVQGALAAIIEVTERAAKMLDDQTYLPGEQAWYARDRIALALRNGGHLK